MTAHRISMHWTLALAFTVFQFISKIGQLYHRVEAREGTAVAAVFSIVTVSVCCFQCTIRWMQLQIEQEHPQNEWMWNALNYNVSFIHLFAHSIVHSNDNALGCNRTQTWRGREKCGRERPQEWFEGAIGISGRIAILPAIMVKLFDFRPVVGHPQQKHYVIRCKNVRNHLQW